MYLLSTDAGNFAFILPPKTGTRSVERALRGLRAKRIRGRHGVDLDAMAARSYATIRNPFDVLVSWYHYAPAGRRRTFAEWYQWDVVENHNDYLLYSTLPGAEHASELMRYEDGLEAELNRALAFMGIEHHVHLDHIGRASDRKSYAAYYTPELRADVERRYAKDLTDYGYSF